MPGEYRVEVQIHWAPNTVKDYVLRVYSDWSTSIRDDRGNTNQNAEWSTGVRVGLDSYDPQFVAESSAIAGMQWYLGIILLVLLNF